VPSVVGKSNGRYVSAYPLTDLADANMDGGGTAAGYMIIGADVGADGIQPVGMVGTITYSRGGKTSSNSPGKIDVICQSSHRTANLVARFMVHPGSRTIFTGFFTATYAGKKVYLVGLTQSGGGNVNGVYFDGILFNDNEANNIFKVVRVGDIPDLAPYTERSSISYPVTSSSPVEVGTSLGDVMAVGAFGLGSDQGLRIPNYDYNMIDRSGFYQGPGAIESTNAPANNTLGDLKYGAAIAAIRSSADGFIIGARSKEIQFRTKNSSTWSPYYRFYTDANTTKASDGTLKAASPVARIASPDACTRSDIDESEFEWCGYGVANDEARGIEIIRDDLGVYRVTGAKSLASSGWRLLPPQDPDGSGELGIVRAEQKDDGIIIKLFRRKMVLADGEIVIQPGEPIDVPANSWIDVRLDMSEPAIPPEPESYPDNEEPLIQPE